MCRNGGPRSPTPPTIGQSAGARRSGGAHTPASSRIVSGSSDDTVRVWDVETAQDLIQLTGYIGPVYSVAYSPDGSQIVSGSEDPTIRLWYVDVDYLLDLADSLIQRDPPIFLGDERARFGFDVWSARDH